MSADEVLQEVANTVGDMLGLEAKELDMDADLKSLGVDELAEVEIMIYLEDEMKVVISHEDFQNTGSIRGIADYLDKHMKK